MLYSLLSDIEQKFSDKVALQIKRKGSYVRYSYREVMEKASALGCRLRNLGAKERQHIALWGESIPEWAIAYLGIHFAGAVAVPLDVQLSREAVENLLQFCEVEVVICSVSLEQKARAIGEKRKLTVLTLEPGDAANGILQSEPASQQFAAYQCDKDDVMSVIFTSGTTGDPKGVMLTCGNFLAGARAALEVCKGVTADDVFLCVLPLYHCYAFTSTIIAPLIIGATTTFQPLLQGPAIVEAMQETGVTFMSGVPKLFVAFDRAICERIAAQPLLKRIVFNILYRISRWARLAFGWNLGKRFFGQIHARFGARFRFFMTGGAKLDPAIAERFWNLGITITEGYGLTETAPIITLNPVDRFTPGSAGKPVSCVEVRIVDPDAAGVGEIAMRGDTLMKGYYKNEQATRAVIRDGWFHTGDLGYLKDDFLYITGRAKEVIVLGSGKNIYPEEVEKAYEASPVIAEICVMAAADNERLHALVIPDFDEIRRRKSPSIRTEVKFHIEQTSLQLPSYMRVSSFAIVTEPFPRTSLGKLKRTAIALQEEKGKESEDISGKLSDRERRLLAKPGSEAILQKIKELADYEGEIYPWHSLELDIGLESLRYMELLTKLEDFGIDTGDGIPTYTHVRDILAALPDSDSNSGTTTDFSWKGLLEKPVSPPLEELFALDRGFFSKLCITAGRLALRPLLFLLFGGRNRGFARLAQHQGPIIIAPNHQSYLDPPMLYTFLPGKVLFNMLFTAMDTIFSKWPFSKLVHFFWIIKTASSETSLSSLQYAAHALQKGHSLCMFPEGLRSSDGSVRPPLVGMGILACECQATVYPILLEGGMDSLSRAKPGFHLCNMRFTVLDPIIPPQKQQYSEEDYQLVVAKWHDAIVEKMHEQQ